ncbi:CLUMA_CG021651, isoform A [Clunio marinus]|uniref:CLUMA_CG021651, isoform A n=1 Tax=Clunio marinus TaxID=568069 RepID=A0A1J1JAJ7_9DIPT|nr:CLUMA_CG021651, isoform A [Clunio marinus]
MRPKRPKDYLKIRTVRRFFQAISSTTITNNNNKILLSSRAFDFILSSALRCFVVNEALTTSMAKI